MRGHPNGLIDYHWDEFNRVPPFECAQWRTNVAYGSFADAQSSDTRLHTTMVVDIHSRLANSLKAAFQVQQTRILRTFAVQ